MKTPESRLNFYEKSVLPTYLWGEARTEMNQRPSIKRVWLRESMLGKEMHPL